MLEHIGQGSLMVLGFWFRVARHPSGQDRLGIEHHTHIGRPSLPMIGDVNVDWPKKVPCLMIALELIMPTVQIEKKQLLEAVLQMPEQEMEQFIAKAFSLRAREKTRALPEREAELLLNINQGLPSATQERLNELIDKRRAETISAKELRQLKKLTDQIEKSDAKRLELLTELAHLRNVPLRKLIKQLGLKPVPHG